MKRVDPRPVEARNLIRAGALEGFGSIPEMLKQIENGSWQTAQLSLFDFNNVAEVSTQDWSLEELVAAQEEILGVGVAAHPLELHARQIAQTGALTTVEVAGRVGQSVRVAGMRQAWRRVFGGLHGKTRRGEYIYFMALEDLEGMLDVVISPGAYRKSRVEMIGEGPFVVEGAVEINRTSGEPFIRADKIWRVLG
jgi:DNA polymerase-3 subunit alpha